MRVWKRAARALIIGLVALLLLGGGILLRGIALPAPTGPYAVGRATFHWIDATRPEVLAPAGATGGKREVIANLWYPATPAPSRPTAPYFAGLDALADIFTPLEWLGVRSVQTHALEEATVAPAQGRYPVILFSPGNRANSAFYSAALEDLASQGYIVAALDHPYDALGVVLADGTVAKFAEQAWPPLAADPQPGGETAYQRFYRARVGVRAADAVFVLDQLQKLGADPQSRFGGRLDLAHTGIVGHSIGGVAAGEACRIDGRFRACLNLDGLTDGQPFYPSADGSGPQQPYMVMLKAEPGPSDAQLAAWQMTRDTWLAGYTRRIDQALQHVRAAGYKVVVRGFTHDSFGDTPLMYPSLVDSLTGLRLRAGAAAYRQVAVTRAYTHAFFDQYLKGQTTNLLNGPQPAYPEVAVDRYNG